MSEVEIVLRKDNPSLWTLKLWEIGSKLKFETSAQLHTATIFVAHRCTSSFILKTLRKKKCGARVLTSGRWGCRSHCSGSR